MQCAIFLIFVQYQSYFQQHLQANPVCNSNPLIHLRLRVPNVCLEFLPLVPTEDNPEPSIRISAQYHDKKDTLYPKFHLKSHRTACFPQNYEIPKASLPEKATVPSDAQPVSQAYLFHAPDARRRPCRSCRKRHHRIPLRLRLRRYRFAECCAQSDRVLHAH